MKGIRGPSDRDRKEIFLARANKKYANILTVNARLEVVITSVIYWQSKLQSLKLQKKLH
jgi:hypothetical protein